MATNLNFNDEYRYFDTILTYAGNTFLSFILLFCLLMILGASCISSTLFYPIPSLKPAIYCEALYTVGHGSRADTGGVQGGHGPP